MAPASMTAAFMACPRDSNEGGIRRRFFTRSLSQVLGTLVIAGFWEFSRALRPQFIVTTDEVLTELLTFSAGDQQLRLEASLVVNDVLADETSRAL
jgi:hypothetical protein